MIKKILCAVLFLSLILTINVFAIDFNSVIQQVQPAIQPAGQTDTGASGRDAYMKQQQADQATQQRQTLVDSMKSRLIDVKIYLDSNKMQSASDQIRMVNNQIKTFKEQYPANIGEIAGVQSELSGYEKIYNEKAGATAQVAGGEDTVREYGNFLFGECSNLLDGFDNITAYGGVAGKAQHFYDTFKIAGEKKAAAEPSLAAARNNSNMGTYISHIDTFNKKLEDTIKGPYSAAIKSLVARANKDKSYDDANAAKLFVDGVLLLDPNNAAVAKFKPVTDKTLASIGGNLGAEGIQNAGKMLFFKSPGGAGPADKFTGDDTIYAIAYLKGPVKTITKGNSVRGFLIVDGEHKVSREFGLDKSKDKDVKIEIEIAPDPATAKQMGGKEYMKGLSELAEGFAYKVQFKYTNYADEIMADGTFDLDLTGGKGTFGQRVEQFEKAALAKVTMAKPKWKNPALEADIMATFKKEAAGKGETPIKVVLVDPAWQVYRNPISGAIEYRTVGADVAVLTDDGKYHIYELTYEQIFDGSSYGPTQYRSIGGNYEILKENIK